MNLHLTNAYNFDKINETLDKFENVERDNTIITSFDDRVICSVDISKKYYNFDFAKFCKSIVSEIDNYFTPDAYLLKIRSGIQEFNLVGEEVEINGEKYLKMFSIINSTNKQRALAMNIGLVRRKNNSGSVHVSFRNKHYKSSMPTKIVSFSDNLINFNIDIEYQIKTIEDLAKKEVSFLTLVKNLTTKPNGQLIKSMPLKVRALSKKLESSYGYSQYIETLRTPLSEEAKDFTISAIDVHNAYTELFLNYDTSIVARESRRILDAIG